MTTTTALVGPLPQIRYQDGTREVYTPPADTRDPRYKACMDHRRACDCREAVFAEQMNEMAGERFLFKKYESWAAAVAVLHQRVPNRYVPDYCDTCNVAWPCATWKLTADADWMTGLVDRQYGGQVIKGEPS